ncbi:MAG: hypothetical protein NVS9B7_03780 [Flavisolibacter sp.]
MKLNTRNQSNMHRIIILILIYLPYPSFGQNDSTIRNLIFEGAGIRGIAYCGTIEVLEKNSILKNVTRVGGTSAGAITALCLSLGYHAEEIQTLITSTSFKKFNEGKYFFIGGMNRMIRNFGWYRGGSFEKWLSKTIKFKTNNADITFRELHDKGFKDLFITGTNLTLQKNIIFSYENFPNMMVKDAIRISMSIPLYFEAVFMDSVGNIVRNPLATNNLQVMVDGGILSNFPIHMFDSTRYLGLNEANRSIYNYQTLGFRIDRKEQIDNDQTGKDLAPIKIKNFKTYLKAIYSIIIEKLNRQSLTLMDWQRTISISDGNIQPRIRKMKKAEIQLLLNNGKQSASDYFKSHMYSLSNNVWPN